MLVLTRRLGESVIIGEDVYCTVLGVKGYQVRLGFDAPQSLPIHRDEIQRRIWREKQDSETPLASQDSVVERLIRQFESHKASAVSA